MTGRRNLQGQQESRSLRGADCPVARQLRLRRKGRLSMPQHGGEYSEAWPARPQALLCFEMV
jgi:hypothetical protein